MLECKDCCIYDTEACRYGKYALEHDMSKNCDDFIVEHNKAYNKAIDDYFHELNRNNLITNENNLIMASMIAEQLKEQNNE